MIQAAPVLQFDEPTHTYTLDGVAVPSVTQCIREAGLIDVSRFTDASRWRGSAAHLACQYDDEGDLDFDSLDDGLKPLVSAWRLFKTDYQLQCSSIEELRFSPVYRYAGTIDRIGTIREQGVPAVIDIKTGPAIPSYALQLAGYAMLLENPYGYHRLAVQLKQDGSYAVHQYAVKDLRADLNVFLSAVVITHWKRREK